MENNFSDKYAINIDLKESALSQADIDKKLKTIKVGYRNNLSFVFALTTLAIGVTYRAITLNYDGNFELFKISLHIGAWFGLFAGVMIDGNRCRKLQMIIVGIIVSSAAGLFASMIVTMVVGHTTIWITSINILASALATMWLMTYYDEVLKGFDSVRMANDKEFSYIKKAAYHFEELDQYCDELRLQKRMPLVAEYWAFRDWIKAKANSN